MSTFPWDISNNGHTDNAFCKFVATDDNAYEIFARYVPASYRQELYKAEPMTGKYIIYRAYNNREGSSMDETIYESPEFPAMDLKEVLNRAESTFLRFDRPVRALSADEYHMWNDIIDPHNVKNMTSDYMIMGRPKGSKAHWGAYNGWNGKFGSIRWGLRIKPKDKESVERQLPALRQENPDYDIELRQGSGTYFDLNRKRGAKR